MQTYATYISKRIVFGKSFMGFVVTLGVILRFLFKRMLIN